MLRALNRNVYDEQEVGSSSQARVRINGCERTARLGRAAPARSGEIGVSAGVISRQPGLFEFCEGVVRYRTPDVINQFDNEVLVVER